MGEELLNDVEEQRCDAASITGVTNSITSPIIQSLWDTPMSQRITVRLNLRGETPVDFFGRSNGKLTLINATETAGLGITLTVHEAGHNYWAARGAQAYAPASLHTLLVERTSQFEFKGVVLASFDAPANDKVRDELTKTLVARLTQS